MMYYDEDAFLAEDSDFADLAFVGMPVEAQVMVIDDILADASPKRRDALLRNLELFGIEAEARSVGLRNPEELGRYLLPISFQRLAKAVDSALLARLPGFA